MAITVAGGAMFVPEPHRAYAATPPLADVRALLDGRSPGARAAGALYQTKLGFDHTGPGPRERVLDQYRDHPVGPAEGGAPGAGDPGTPLPGGVGPAGLIDGGSGEEGVAGTPSFADTGFFGTPGIGGAVLPGDGGGTTTPTPPGAMSGVPEPATWLAMMIGFAAIGLTLRRRAGAAAFLA